MEGDRGEGKEKESLPAGRKKMQRWGGERPKCLSLLYIGKIYIMHYIGKSFWGEGKPSPSAGKFRAEGRYASHTLQQVGTKEWLENLEARLVFGKLNTHLSPLSWV